MTGVLRLRCDRVAALCRVGIICAALPAAASAAVINRGVEGPPLCDIRPAPKSIYPDQQVITAQPSPSEVDPAYLEPVLMTDTTDPNLANLHGVDCSPKLAYAVTGKAAREARIDKDGIIVFKSGKVDFSPVHSVTPGEAPNSGSHRFRLRTGCCKRRSGIASRSDLNRSELFDDLSPFRPLACLFVHRDRAGLDIGVEDVGGFGQLLVEDVQTDGFVSGADADPLPPFDRTCSRPVRREAGPVDLFFRLGVSDRPSRGGQGEKRQGRDCRLEPWGLHGRPSFFGAGLGTGGLPTCSCAVNGAPK